MESSLLTFPILENLNIGYNNLETIPSVLFKLPLLHCLIISSNQLKVIPKIPPNLKILDAACNNLKSIPQIHATLRQISLNSNHITTWGKSLKSLTHLYISLNRISEFPTIKFTELVVLDISRNALSSLPDMKIFTPNLKTLDISHNFFTELPLVPHSLDNYDCHHNQLTRIPDWIIDLKNLSRLDIGNNNIEIVPLLPNSIKHLSIMDNPITTVIATELPHLRNLAIVRTRLSRFPEFGHSQITDVIMTRGCLRFIDLERIPTTITKLNLSANRIKEVPDDLFNLPALTSLNLSKNRIKQVPRSIKRSSIQFLNLSSNPLEKARFPRRATSIYVGFCGLKHLPNIPTTVMTLVANNNKLRNIKRLPHLWVLILSVNKFKTLPQLPSSLTRLDVSCNPLTELPPTFSFKYMLALDITCTGVTSLPTLNLPKIKSLHMGGNPHLTATLDLDKMPFLDSLDISFSPNVAVTGPAKIRDGLTSTPGTAFRYIHPSPAVGYSEMCGTRDAMEDAIIVRPDTGVYAVFDGHGGAQISTYCANHMSVTDYSEQAISDAVDFLAADIKAQRMLGGSTMSLVMLRGREALIAHIGDSRVVVVDRDGTVSFVTVDHKPIMRAEFERVRDAGGLVSANRVNRQIAVSRSIGDFYLAGITSKPEIQRAAFTESNKWLIVACDGLFETVSTVDIGLMTRSYTSASRLATDLKNYAYCRMSQDNISVIVVDLDQIAEI